MDEFQRAGRGFLLAVKQAADRDRARGQLLLTGSTNHLADRGLSATLAGRAGRLPLWPLSMGERLGVRETFLDHLFEPVAWPGRAIVSREALRPISEIRLEGELRRLLRLLAARTGQELVVTGVAGDAEISRETAANYVTLLEALHLVTLLPAWSTSLTTRAQRRPRVLVVDTGLAAELGGLGERTFALTADGTAAGALFETFVITEVRKQTTWSERGVDLSHFRDRDGPRSISSWRTGDRARSPASTSS